MRPGPSPRVLAATPTHVDAVFVAAVAEGFGVDVLETPELDRFESEVGDVRDGVRRIVDAEHHVRVRADGEAHSVTRCDSPVCRARSTARVVSNVFRASS